MLTISFLLIKFNVKTNVVAPKFKLVCACMSLILVVPPLTRTLRETERDAVDITLEILEARDSLELARRMEDAMCLFAGELLTLSGGAKMPCFGAHWKYLKTTQNVYMG